MSLFYLRIYLNKLKFKLAKYFSGPPVDADIDPAYYDALEFIKGKKTVTYNQLQKHLNIGYARTTNLLDLLEKYKNISPKKDYNEKRVVRV